MSAGPPLTSSLTSDSRPFSYTHIDFRPDEVRGPLFAGQKVVGSHPNYHRSKWPCDRVHTVPPRYLSRFHHHGACDVSLSLTFSCISPSHVSRLWSVLWFRFECMHLTTTIVAILLCDLTQINHVLTFALTMVGVGSPIRLIVFDLVTPLLPAWALPSGK